MPVKNTAPVDCGNDFGLKWKAPLPLLQKRLFCARHNVGNLSQFEQRKAIISELWKPSEYEMNAWSDTRLRSTCEHSFVTWFAAGGSGKTRDAAAIALEYWLEAPYETAIIVCSTSVKLAKKRIFNDVCFLWNRLSPALGYKGILTPSDMMLRWEDGDAKNGIFGLAVADGPVEDAINQLRGIHTTRVWWILDEMQGVEEAIMGVLPNHARNPEPRFLGIGNPTRKTSLLGRYSEPIGGWSTIERAVTPDWPIDEGVYPGTGRAYFFDGRKSPACLDPEWGKRNPWMINKAQIDKHIEKSGLNSPEVWVDSIGFFPEITADNTVLDAQTIEKFRCREDATWTNGFEEGWALDPAFSEGGDSRVLQFFRFGMVHDDYGSRWVIELGEFMEVPLDGSLVDEPAEYQILNFVREQCRLRRLKPEDGGTDSSGTGRGLHSVFVKEWGAVMGIEFGGAPTDMVVDGSGKTAKEIFDRRSSELNVMVRNFALQHGLRGLKREAEDQFCTRLMVYEGRGRWVVESKKVMKKRGEHSPDHADAVAIAVDVARRRGASIGLPECASVPRGSGGRDSGNGKPIQRREPPRN